MTGTALAGLILRELRAVRRELEAYERDEQVWQSVPGMPNTAGTLALHLAGNLRHYVGAVLGGTGYVRDRPAEFSRRDVPRRELIADLAEAERVVAQVVPGLDATALASDYPEAIGEVRVPAGEYLAHLAVHLAYHLGQIDAHRRVVTGRSEGIGAVNPRELAGARPSET